MAMEDIPFADLEAELGCLDTALPDPLPRRDHGSSDDFFDLPIEITSRLEKPSKTKSLYQFGDNGTLAWVTPAGSLLFAASCIHDDLDGMDKLIGVEYKKSIGRGDYYEDRAEVLEEAVHGPINSGYGIGVSLDIPVEPFDVFWVHNRWPRFRYQSEFLDIRLQYYVDSHSVVQQFQIRNDTEEEAYLPFTFSSDICFREHESEDQTSHPVPSSASPERLLLFQNSEIVVRNKNRKAQVKMGLFLNAKRISIWYKQPLRNDDLDAAESNNSQEPKKEMCQTEARLRDIILRKRFPSASEEDEIMDVYSKYYDRKPRRERSEHNFAQSRSRVVIPPHSTQELCAMIQLLPLPLHEAGLVGRPESGKTVINQQPVTSEEETDISPSWRRLFELRDEFLSLPLDLPKTEFKRKMHEIVAEHLLLAEKAPVKDWQNEARYNFGSACFIAESFFHDDLIFVGETRLRYVTFLEENDWNSDALQLAKELVRDLSTQASENTKVNTLLTKVISRLALMHQAKSDFETAENLYEHALSHFIKGAGINDQTPTSTHFLERLAWTQIRQGKYEKADKNYSLLLDQSLSHRQILLRNRAFIKRQNAQLREAQSLYETALQEIGSEYQGSREGFHYTADALYALSGLFACATHSHTDLDEISAVTAFSTAYLNINKSLMSSTCHRFPFIDDPMHFAIARQLEFLLSVCSIPIKAKGKAGLAFVDADPLNCLYEGRFSYFQFRFLAQSLGYLDAVQYDERSKLVFANRIQATCEAHLVWVFEIADSNETWGSYHAVGGNNIDLPFHKTSRAIEGAVQFLKLYLYLSTWKEEWEFVLRILHLHIDKWFSYLKRTQHMGNLWVGREDMKTFRPYNTISRDDDDITKMYPRYELSNFALLWLALSQPEKMIGLLEHEHHVKAQEPSVSTDSMVKEVRQCFASYQEFLSSERVRANIIKTFKIPTQIATDQYVLSAESSVDAAAKSSNGLQSRSAYFHPGSRNSQTQYESIFKAGVVSEQHQEIIAFRRTIHQDTFDVQPTDSASMEASILGIFKGDQAEAAWRRTLKLQSQDITTFEDSRRLALTLFASHFTPSPTRSLSRKDEAILRTRLATALYDSGIFATSIKRDAPGSIRVWSAATYETASLLLAGLFKKCREILPLCDRQEECQQGRNAFAVLMTRDTSLVRTAITMPRSVNSVSRNSQEDVVETAFLPEWMYPYPDFIHKDRLIIDVEKEIGQLEPFDGLTTAARVWRRSRRFNNGVFWRFGFKPAIFDSGRKHRASYGDISASRHMSVEDYDDRDKFWERMLEPRLPDQAKKRLIEISTPKQEKPNFIEFFRRHVTSENLFGERAHRQGNIWETEFHLGFHQCEDGYFAFGDLEGSRSNKTVFNKSAFLQGHEVKPVAISFRFVGDLLDRYWTCHFLSSATPSAVRRFKGLIDKFFTSPDLNNEKTYKEKQGQRKLLELFFVERALSEVQQNIDRILSALEKELDETLDLQSDKSEYVLDYSSRSLNARNLLAAVSQRLDSSISAIEQWEKREDNRDHRSRWSRKDMERYGEKLRESSLRCKFKIQQLRLQQNRLKEQRRTADQRHNELVSDKSLQEAQRNTRSAADVRLFTYVTIIFLPLSFSSSLFSMAGKPSGHTVSVMVPTTVVALAATLLLLSNMKTLGRNWHFWVSKLNAHTRRKMNTREHAADWGRISNDLEEMTKRRLETENTAKRPLAETKWYYCGFWISHILSLPRTYIQEAFRGWRSSDMSSIKHSVLVILLFAPICVFIFVLQMLGAQVIDLLSLLWIMAQCVSSWVVTSLGVSQGSSAQDLALKWLESPPRPLQNYIKKLQRRKAMSSATKDTPEKGSTEAVNEEHKTQDKPPLRQSLRRTLESLFDKFRHKQSASPENSSSSEAKV